MVYPFPVIRYHSAKIFQISCYIRLLSVIFICGICCHDISQKPSASWDNPKIHSFFFSRKSTGRIETSEHTWCFNFGVLQKSLLEADYSTTAY